LLPDNWYAVRVRQGYEARVAELLKTKGYELFVPEYRSVRRCPGGRMSERREALFPGYIFCYVPAEVRGTIVATSGVISVVSTGRVPVAVDRDEIRALQVAVSSGDVRPYPFLDEGQRVRIERGPLQGVEGTVIRLKSEWRLVISITVLRRAAALEIDVDAVRAA
jgi:transcription antitermination factor NusG